MSRASSVRPGWFVLVAVIVYAVVVSLVLAHSRAEIRRLRAAAPAAQTAAPAAANAGQASPPRSTTTSRTAVSGTTAPPGLWFPLPGAQVPKNTADLPGAARAYRHGVSQGFDFVGGDAGIPVSYGQPVIAAAAGQIVRADTNYVEMTPEQWKQLLTEVSNGGADASQLDRLRGRQIWEQLPDGRVLRYAFLAGIRDGISKGIKVYRGEVIGYVGNSGTGDGVAHTTLHPRLHFEVWQGEKYFGEGLTPDEVRMKAASLFTGP